MSRENDPLAPLGSSLLRTTSAFILSTSVGAVVGERSHQHHPKPFLSPARASVSSASSSSHRARLRLQDHSPSLRRRTRIQTELHGHQVNEVDDVDDDISTSPTTFIVENERERKRTAFLSVIHDAVAAEDTDTLQDACKRLKAHPQFRPGQHYYGFELPPKLKETAKCNDGSHYKFYWNPCRAAEAISGKKNRDVSDPAKWLFYLNAGGDAPTPEKYARRHRGQKTRPTAFSQVGSPGLGWNKDRSDATDRTQKDFLAFQDFQKVALPYCSSDKWIGNADEADWTVNRKSGGSVDKNVRFHGSRIVKAVATYVRDTVKRTTLLDKAESDGGITEAILSGSSAGGGGTGLNACAVFKVMHSRSKEQEASQSFPLRKFGILIDSGWYVRGPPTAECPRYHQPYKFVAGETNPDGEKWNGLEMDYQVGAGTWKAHIESGCASEGQPENTWKCFFPRKHALYFLPNAKKQVCGEQLEPDDPVQVRPFFGANGYDGYLQGRGDWGRAAKWLPHLRARGKQYLQEMLDVVSLTPAHASMGFFLSASFGHVIMGFSGGPPWNYVMQAQVQSTLLNEVLKKWWSYDYYKTSRDVAGADEKAKGSVADKNVWKAKGQYANPCLWGKTHKCVTFRFGTFAGSNPTIHNGNQNHLGGFNDGLNEWNAALEAANAKGLEVQKQMDAYVERMRKETSTQPPQEAAAPQEPLLHGAQGTQLEGTELEKNNQNAPAPGGSCC